ncbi:hypothetical protein [Bacillus marasmi]|uniref:hypothetical protein n=1 Tax=Bacillus marasmi TaxID=1926279 RepID=UPI0011C9DAD7|nr:hypothetical protein [Bacillus marasmi]
MYHAHPYQPNAYRGYEDQRFIGFGLLPFLAGGALGLAASPFFFNRPCCPPPYPPYPPYPGYPPTPYGYGPGPYPYR